MSPGSQATALAAGLVGDGSGALAIRAKRKWGQALENKRSRETTDFAPPMISRTYDGDAKPIVSLCEMNPVVFAGFSPRRGPKRK
jgi:hypothetical protein